MGGVETENDTQAQKKVQRGGICRDGVEFCFTETDTDTQEKCHY